jgi:hypothetical protein
LYFYFEFIELLCSDAKAIACGSLST